MKRFEGEEYLPLNNLDEFDYCSVGSAVDFDPTPKADITLEEKYLGADPEELDRLSVQSFYDGLDHIRKIAGKIDFERLNAKPDEDKTEEDIIYGALRWVISRIVSNHGRPSVNTQIVDRIQDGFLNLVTASRKCSKGGLIMRLVDPHLSDNLTRNERGADPWINRGDMIRISSPYYGSNRSFYALKERKEKLEVKLGFSVEVEDLFFFGDFTQEEIDWFRKHNIEHRPFNEDDEEVLQVVGVEEPIEEFLRSSPHCGVEKALNFIDDDRQRDIVVRCNGLLGEELINRADLGKELGVTRERVRQLEKQAIKKLLLRPDILDVVQGVA
jgi:hypothetical protein